MKTENRILKNDQVAEIYVTYSQRIDPKNRITIHRPEDAAKVFKYVWDYGTIEMKESFKVLLLNQGNQVLGVVNISEGGISTTQVDTRLIFSVALKTLSTQIILAH